jgi:tight adherence protein B
MGVLVGLALGLGLAMVAWTLTEVSSAPRRPSLSRRAGGRGRRLLAEAGLARLGLGGVVAWSLGAAAVVFIVAAGVSQSPVLATTFGALAAYTPWAFVRAQRSRRQVSLRAAWPDVVDDLTSAVRAGLALPEALIQLGRRGPVEFRPAFEQFAAAYRAGGRFGDSLDLLKESLADPVGDRVVESLRMAREVGGNDLGRLLRTLSQFLREDARTRGELEARQAWTVNGARLAVAAPWLLLALLATRPQAVAAYDTVAGMVVLGAGAGACFLAYRLMMRIGRLPAEDRVLR